MRTTPASPVVVDLDAWMAGGVYLSLAERTLLGVLLERPGCAVSRDRLYVAYWGYAAPRSRAVESIIRRLRTKTGIPIDTVRGYGWRIPAEAIEIVHR